MQIRVDPEKKIKLKRTTDFGIIIFKCFQNYIIIEQDDAK